MLAGSDAMLNNRRPDSLKTTRKFEMDYGLRQKSDKWTAKCVEMT